MRTMWKVKGRYKNTCACYFSTGTAIQKHALLNKKLGFTCFIKKKIGVYSMSYKTQMHI